MPILKVEKTPVEKAIEALIEGVKKDGKAVIDGVIVHPTDVATLRALMENTPMPAKEGPLMKAYREAQVQGRSVTGIAWDEQHVHEPTELEQQLADSIFALVEVVAPATTEEIQKHLPHLAGSTTRVRRVQDE